MIKPALVTAIITFILILSPSARAVESDSKYWAPGMSARVNVEEYCCRYGTMHAPEEKSCRQERGLPKDVAEQEWNHDDDFLGPFHDGVEGHFTSPWKTCAGKERS
jgi:hypothetical protein